ncbi:hypothetical protein JCM10450v2_006378 [Rhodotorula kratochvilovae]
MSKDQGSERDGRGVQALDSQRSPPKDDSSKAYFLRLPDELILSVARYYNPPIPFELGHFTLPSRYLRDGRSELRALTATCKRFAKIVRPLLYRTLVFVDDKRTTQTVHFYGAKDIHSYVRELYWQPSYLYNDMSPIYLPLAQNLTYLVLAFLPQNVPDDFVAEDYSGLTTMRRSFTDALRQLKHLEALEIPFWESREDRSFHFGKSIMPALVHVSIGDWQQWDAFEVEHDIDVVKWLIHPDLDFEEGVIRGFFEHLGRQTRVLQFAAQSGWGRTDLPQGLTENLQQVSWYKNIKNHPLESFTLHGFNPITSHKKEWVNLLPAFLSLWRESNIANVAFIDVPSLRNAKRHTIEWARADPLPKVETLQISLALDEDTKDKGADGGEDAEEDDDADDVEGGPEGAVVGERVSGHDLEPLLDCFPNLKNLALANFHRAKQPTHESGDNEGEPVRKDSDEYDRFATETFQPAAREFVGGLRLFERFAQLEQVVFRSVDAALAVRFRRDDEAERGWHEELRRLY